MWQKCHNRFNLERFDLAVPAQIAGKQLIALASTEKRKEPVGNGGRVVLLRDPAGPLFVLSRRSGI
jgi:hypothetical protein